MFSNLYLVLSIVPSLETPICEQQTHYLSEKSAGLSDRVELVSISLDAPEIQGKFAREAEIENVTFLSDAAAEAFGRAHGLLIEQPHILARAVIVVDARNIVRYLQVVPDVSHMPDLEAAFGFARELIAVGGS
jgi:thiol peroxidase